MLTPQERKQKQLEILQKRKLIMERVNKAKQIHKIQQKKQKIIHNIEKLNPEKNHFFEETIKKRERCGYIYEQAFDQAESILANPRKTLQKMDPTVRHYFFKVQTMDPKDVMDIALDDLAIAIEDNIDEQQLQLERECNNILDLIKDDIFYEHVDQIKSRLESIKISTLWYEWTIEKQKAQGRMVDSITPEYNYTEDHTGVKRYVDMIKVVDYYWQKVYNNSRRDGDFYERNRSKFNLPPLESLIINWLDQHRMLYTDRMWEYLTTDQIERLLKSRQLSDEIFHLQYQVKELESLTNRDKDQPYNLDMLSIILEQRIEEYKNINAIQYEEELQEQRERLTFNRLKK